MRLRKKPPILCWLSGSLKGKKHKITVSFHVLTLMCTDKTQSGEDVLEAVCVLSGKNATKPQFDTFPLEWFDPTSLQYSRLNTRCPPACYETVGAAAGFCARGGTHLVHSSSDWTSICWKVLISSRFPRIRATSELLSLEGRDDTVRVW